MVRNGVIAVLVVAAAGLGLIYGTLGGGDVITGLDGGSPVVQALQHGNWRVAVADQACPSPPEPGTQPSPAYRYLTEHCATWLTHGNWCACATSDEEQLVGEVDEATIPDNVFRRVAVCEHGDPPVREVVYAKLTDEVPPGWRCVLVANRILWKLSYRPVRSKLLEKLQEKCCSACPASCWVSEGAWGQCPYCLLDDNCDSFCPTDGGIP